MEITTLEGRILRDLLAKLAHDPAAIHTVRIGHDGTRVEFEVNGMWSAGHYPLAPEDIQRLARR